MVYNSRLAQEAGLWAQACGRAEAFHDAAFKAYFVDGRNISGKEVLLDLMASAGLDAGKGRQVLEQRSFAPAVDRDWALSKKLGLVAAPTFIMGTDRLVGARPYEALERLVTRGGCLT